MENPIYLRRQVVLHSIPLLLVTSHFPEPALFALSIPSSMLAFLVVGTKRRMYVSNTLFIACLLFPRVYFVCYGFTITSTYVSVASLCLGAFRKDNTRTCMVMESIGLLLSLHSLNNRAVSLFIALLQFANIYYLSSPPVESVDYGEAYEKLVKLFAGASFTNKASEYKKVVESGGKVLLSVRADFLTPLLMGNIALPCKVIICCSSLILNRKLYWLCFFAYLLSVFTFEWLCAFMSFFCDFVPEHPFYKLFSAQILYLLIK